MDKLDKVIADCLSELFEQWKPYLNKYEQAVFILKYFKGYKIFEIAAEISYSEVQVKRFLKSARKKINKLLP